MTRWTMAALVAVLAASMTGCTSETLPDLDGSPNVVEVSPSPSSSGSADVVEAAEKPDYPAPDRNDPAWVALTAEEQQRACEALGISAGCQIEMDECAWTEFAADGDPDQVAGWKTETAIDQGPREYATGEPVLNAAGVPVAYRVAPGDIGEFVAKRFCLTLGYLNAINSVRRTLGAMNLDGGDTINFDAATIFTVGDENGVVHDGAPPSPRPPQR